jgi:catechol 2,3-dioxygenase-like lactoylglutathione lyase family enzyme
MSDKYFIRPVFRVRNVAASVAYYCEKLGCRKRWDHGADGPIIAEVERGDLSVILDSGSVVPKPAGPSVLTLSAEKLIELHREFVERGANIVTPLFEVVWQENTYQFEVEDLDGNLLVFWGDKPA